MKCKILTKVKCPFNGTNKHKKKGWNTLTDGEKCIARYGSANDVQRDKLFQIKKQKKLIKQ